MTESPAAYNQEGAVASVAGRLLVDGNLVKGALVIERGRIVDVRFGDVGNVGQLPAPRLDAEIVSPGLVDLQVNGAFGLEVGGDGRALRALAGRLPSTGVTTFLPTAVSSGPTSPKRTSTIRPRSMTSAPFTRFPSTSRRPATDATAPSWL